MSLREGIDYIMEEGLLVFTSTYLLNRGYCCGSGCKNCPYEYEGVREPLRTQLLAERKKKDENRKG